MTIETALLAAVSAEATVISILYARNLAREKKQDAKLDECEKDRARLAKELTDVWKTLAKQGMHREERDTPQ
jgi:hypothetical protein